MLRACLFKVRWCLVWLLAARADSLRMCREYYTRLASFVRSLDDDQPSTIAAVPVLTATAPTTTAAPTVFASVRSGRGVVNDTARDAGGGRKGDAKAVGGGGDDGGCCSEGVDDGCKSGGGGTGLEMKCVSSLVSSQQEQQQQQQQDQHQQGLQQGESRLALLDGGDPLVVDDADFRNMGSGSRNNDDRGIGGDRGVYSVGNSQKYLSAEGCGARGGEGSDGTCGLSSDAAMLAAARTLPFDDNSVLNSELPSGGEDTGS